MTARPRRANGGNALRLAYWICSKKLELDQFLSEHGVDICLLNETHLAGPSGSLTMFATGQTVRIGVVAQRSLSPGMLITMQCVSGLRHLEATAIHLVLANRLVKIVADYLSPTRPLIESDLNECLSGDLPVLMAGNLNAKNTDWNSRLITTRGALLRDYDNRNACLIYRPDSPTTLPYQQNANPDVLDIVVVKDFVLPVHLTLPCTQLGSPTCPDILSKSIRPPRFQANVLGGTPALP
jgi:hypothetical protein